MRLVKILGSLKFAIGLIAGLVALLTASTLLESAYGTPFAQKTFYTARWFDAFLGLVWINIFCATLTRLPFKKRHTGFVVTHIGILLLLIGALLSRVYGNEGTMMLFEGEKKGAITREGHALEVTRDGRTGWRAELKGGWTKFPYTVDAGGAKVRVLGVTDRAAEKRVVEEGGRDDAPNAAVEVALTSEALGVDETFWLVERDPADPASRVKQIGPAHVELRRKSGVADAVTLRIEETSSGKTLALPLREKTPDTPIPGTALTVRNVAFFPRAKVEGAKLVDSPAEVKFNPAVEFEVADGEGRVERHTRFFLFPNFGSLRGGKKADLFGLKVDLDATFPEDLDPVPVPSLVFFASDGGWTARVSSSKKAPVETPLEPGKAVETGWMDIRAVAKKTLERARVTSAVVENKSGPKGLFAVRVAVGDAEPQWLLEGQKADFGGTSVRLRGETFVLPFSLGLKDFRKVDYPGTSNAASFESDVVLVDERDGTTLGKTIKMNKPLDYAGWRVFQSSYVQDPHFGEASVFSIAKNPGIGLIYGGAALVFVGVILLFYLHPFFNRRPEPAAAPVKRTKKRPETKPHAR